MLSDDVDRANDEIVRERGAGVCSPFTLPFPIGDVAESRAEAGDDSALSVH